MDLLLGTGSGETEFALSIARDPKVRILSRRTVWTC